MRRAILAFVMVAIVIAAAQPAAAPPNPSLASGEPDVVHARQCSDGARSRLELTSLADFGGRIKVRFELHGSPVGHVWRIVFRYFENTALPGYNLVFRGTRMASDSGGLAVVRRYSNTLAGDGFEAIAVDAQTGQRCEVRANIFPTSEPP